jgi:8-oxo-dGTP diphosphatase
MYKIIAKLRLVNDTGKFIISEGSANLLRKIRTCGSLAAAAEQLKMSYRHAWEIIRKINSAMGKPAVESERGGIKGGKTTLTPAGESILQEYDANVNAVQNLLRYGRQPAIAVDGIVVVKGKIALIRRKYPPFKGYYAIPGGFVNYNETVEDAVRREIKEELSVDTKITRLVGVYSDPKRDPRGHVISVAYELTIIGGKLKAGDDAAKLKLIPIDQVYNLQLAFDHSKILQDLLRGRKNY